MRLKLFRIYKNDKCISGILYVIFFGVIITKFYTLERPWKENKTFVSCIYKGIFKVVPFSGKKFKDVFEIKDVENRSAILFHPANHVHELLGCIAIGDKVTHKPDGEYSVWNSRNAMDKLKKLVNNYRKITGRSVYLEIV